MNIGRILLIASVAMIVGAVIGWAGASITNAVVPSVPVPVVKGVVVKGESPAVSPVSLTKCDELMAQAVKDATSSTWVNNAALAASACYQSFMVQRPKANVDSAMVYEPKVNSILGLVPRPDHMASGVPSVAPPKDLDPMTGLKVGTINQLKMGQFAVECPYGPDCLVACAGGKPCRLREIEHTNAVLTNSPDFGTVDAMRGK